MSGRALKNHQTKEETMSLNRKAMVLAVGAALAAPGAYAQVTSKAGSEWEFYGKFYPELAHIKGENPTPAGTPGLSTLLNTSGTNPAATPAVSNSGASNLVNRGEMLVSNSYIGFRGGKSLGGGMKAIWQLEQTVPIDEGVDGTLATRDSFLGVEGGWGTLRLGFMDTPFKKAGDVVGFLGVSSGNFVQTNPVLRQVGFAQGSGGPNRAARFHERRPNAIDFASPNYFGGLQYLMQYSIGNPSETAHTSDVPRDPRFVSMALKWESGPFYFAAMHETHFDMFGASSQFRSQRDASVLPNTTGDGTTAVPTIQPVRLASVMRNSEDPNVNSKDTAGQVTAMFKFGGHTLEADYIKKKYKENGDNSGITGRFMEYKNNAWMVAWEARWTSQVRTAATYVKADAGNCKLFNANCTTAGLEGKQLSLGASFYIDPSTYLFAIYSKIDNGPSARYDNVSNGAPATGEDVIQYAVGLAYNF
jgi:predicted porin